MKNVSLVWFRRDLRDVDNAALSAALAESTGVYCVFVFDVTILERLPHRLDRRVAFIHASLKELDTSLRKRGGGLIVLHGNPCALIPALASQLNVAAVYANRDYEPAAKERDAAVAAHLKKAGIAWYQCRDQVIFDGDQVLTQAGRPYSVFTPYRNAWLKRLHDVGVERFDRHDGRLMPSPAGYELPAIETLGFQQVDLAANGVCPGMSGAASRFQDFIGRLPQYHEARDFPAIRGVSYLSVHLRFGTISVRQLVAHALQVGGEGGMTWLSELVWRDFYFMILDRFPHVVDQSFRSNSMHWSGMSGRRDCRHGRQAVLAIRWLMRRCGNWSTVATCITACAWSRHRS